MDFKAAYQPPAEPEVLPPAPIPPLDLEPVKRALAPYEAIIDQALEEALAVTVIDNEEGLKWAVEAAGEAKRLNNELEAYRKETTKPAWNYKKTVDGLAKHYTDKLARLEAHLKRVMGQYQAKKELERRKAQEAARTASAQLQEKINQEAAAAGVEAPQVTPPAVVTAKETVRTETGTASFKTEWKFEIEDETKLDREYLMPNLAKIRADVKAGQRDIPGVRIWEEKGVSLRV
jgi:uncharacterized membrane protein YgaE (UPF0421/DUF939 family)